MKAVVNATPSWLAEAYRLKGVKEVPGTKSNPTILGWAKALGGWIANFYRQDSTPWCGLFVAHCISATVKSEKLPANPLGALEWRNFGISLTTPSLGAVLVFKRPGGGHVAFYVGEDATTYWCCGGNQSDQVCVTRIAKDRLVAIRWPSKAALPRNGRVFLTASGTISTNEK